MKCSLDSATLQKTLKQAIRFLSAKPQIPILSCFLIEVQDGQMTITATDLHVGIKTSLLCEVSQPGKTVVPAKILTDLVTTFSSSATLESDEKSLIVRSGKTMSTINAFPDQDFPPFPQKDGAEIEVPIAELKHIAEFVAFCASLDETRPILTSLLLSFQPQIAVCTDGFRMAALQHSIEARDLEQVLLPAKSFTEVVKIIENSELQTAALTLSEGQKQAFFTAAETQIVVRVLEGDFPPYQEILAKEFELTASCDAAELSHQIRSAMLFSKEKTSIVQLKISAGEIEVVSQSTMFGQYLGSLPAKLNKPQTIEIAFNGKYILEFLQKIDDQECLIQLNDPLKPAILSSPKMKKYQYVAMPFRMTEN